MAVRGKQFLVMGLLLFLLAGCDDASKSPKGELTIITDPEDATVQIAGSDIELGITPVKEALPPGDYIFRISKLNYKTEWVKFQVKQGRNKALEVKLQPLSASVIINSKPEGAEITFDGAVIGITPHIIRDLPVGKYSASLKLPAFAAREVQWEVPNERPFTVTADLIQNVGTLKIASDPDNASVFIDDEPKGATPFENLVEQGQHKIRIAKDGYAPYEQIVTVEKDKVLPLSLRLEVLPSALTISSRPEDAIVFVNDKQYNNTPTALTSLPPGVYVIRLEKTGFEPAEREVTLTPGQGAEVIVDLESNMGGIDLVVNPPGVKIYLDGKMVGTSEADPNDPGNSKVLALRGLAAGKHTISVSHKRGNPIRKSVTFDIEKGKILRAPPVNLWITNAIIEMKNGKQYTGRIPNPASSADEIIFEHEPGIKEPYKRSDIEKITFLSDEE